MYFQLADLEPPRPKTRRPNSVFASTKWRLGLLLCAVAYYRFSIVNQTAKALCRTVIWPALHRLGIVYAVQTVLKSVQAGARSCGQALLRTSVAQTALQALWNRVNEWVTHLQMYIEAKVFFATGKVLDHLRSSLKVSSIATQ